MFDGHFNRQIAVKFRWNDAMLKCSVHLRQKYTCLYTSIFNPFTWSHPWTMRDIECLSVNCVFYARQAFTDNTHITRYLAVVCSRARFLSLARGRLRLCSANHRPGHWSNLSCDWPSIAWAYSEQDTENGPRSNVCEPSPPSLVIMV